MIRNSFRRASVGIALALCAPQAAFAQDGGTPDYGGYRSLAGLFRIGINITGGGGADFSDSLDLKDAEEADNFLSPDDLMMRYGAQYNDQRAVTGVLDFRGVELVGSYQANSTTLTIRVPAFDEPGRPYLLTFTGATRQDSYDQFNSYFDDFDQGEAERLIRLLLKALSRYSPADPLAGNPGSMQGQLVRSSLDLGSTDSVVEGGRGGGNTAGDPWMIGGNFATSSAGKGGRFDTKRYDLNLQRAFRMFEGGRSQLKFGLGGAYSLVNGARAANVQSSLSLEVPVVARRWSLEPRVAYGITASDQLGSLGHMVTGSVASRYVINGIGRGYFVIGNMVGYTRTLSTAFTGYNIDPGLKNWVFRNGVAYDLPIQLRAGGRSMSVRANYMFTKFAGDKLYTDAFHDVGVSIGLRTRETTARRANDVIRLNVGGVFAKGFRSTQVGIGFRF